MKTLLAAVCCLTLAASAFLAVSYVTLKGTDDLRPVWSLFAFVVPSLVVVAVLVAGFGGTALRNPAAWLCWLIVATGGSPHLDRLVHDQSNVVELAFRRLRARHGRDSHAP